MKTYEAQGDIATADCIIGHSFGTSTDTGSVNYQLAGFMQQHADGRPMIADRTLVDTLPDGDAHMAHVVEGAVTNIKAQGVGTWGTLVEAQQYMKENGLNRAIMVAQAHHIRRVVRQAAKLGMSAVVPAGLPTDFDNNSDQIWTRSPYLWVPFNALGSLLLKRRGQL
ncbi:MAG TPA: hypothetical protein VKQ34_03895 [Candidatus Saccharimonadales bacterium]|nr:hypothetical protein [Candidatus Saccharimonadales bacterium]